MNKILSKKKNRMKNGIYIKYVGKLPEGNTTNNLLCSY